MVSKTCYLRFRALPSRDLCASDVSEIVYGTGALLKKAMIGGMFPFNCDCDVSNPRCTGYIRYHRSDMVVRTCTRHWFTSLGA